MNLPGLVGATKSTATSISLSTGKPSTGICTTTTTPTTKLQLRIFFFYNLQPNLQSKQQADKYVKSNEYVELPLMEQMSAMQTDLHQPR